MIIDKLSNARQYYKLGTRIETAFEYLRNTDLSMLDVGKYQIDDNEVFALVSEYETKNLEQGLWEAHKKYIDIQYMLSGTEKMGYSCIEGMKTTIEYSEEKDILFLEGEGDFFAISDGTFALFTPEDAHMPGISAGKKQGVKKLIVKVLVDSK